MIYIQDFLTSKNVLENNNYDLLKRIVLAPSCVGNLILDPFCGTGKLENVCIELGRRYVGFDIYDYKNGEL